MLTKNEAAYLVGFLSELEDRFGNDGCNDMFLKDTPENRQMYHEAELDEADLDEALQVPYGSENQETKIGTNNILILNYLRDRMMKEYGLSDKEIPNTASW